jgi:hypothetical protein
MRLLELDQLSRELKTSPERLRELANEARLPFSFSPERGLLVDSRDLETWRSAVARVDE